MNKSNMIKRNLKFFALFLCALFAMSMSTVSAEGPQGKDKPNAAEGGASNESKDEQKGKDGSKKEEPWKWYIWLTIGAVGAGAIFALVYYFMLRGPKEEE